MKRLIVVFALCLIIFTGCASDGNYEAYMKAVEKTENIKMSSSSVDVEVDQNKDNGNKTLKFKMDGYFNREKDQGIFDIYLYYDELGNDVSYFRKSSSEQYIKLPFYDEYIKLEDEFNTEDMANENMKAIVEEIGFKWQNIIKEENVFVGEKLTVENDDGSVKVRKFTVKPNKNQINEIVDAMKINILDNKEKIYKIFNEISSNNPEIDEIDEDLFRDTFEDAINSINIESYEEISYVDSDGYIIDKEVNMNISYKNKGDLANPISSQNIKIKIKNWDIEREIKLEFPEIKLGEEN